MCRFPTLPLSLLALSLAALVPAGAVAGDGPAPLTLFPSPKSGGFRFTQSNFDKDNPVFAETNAPDALTVAFADRDDQDNYMHVDLGPVDLAPYAPGGYVEVDAEIDRAPVLRLTLSVSEPDRFWQRRQMLEPEAPMAQGRQTYRFYPDLLTARRMAEKRDHLYLFIHDYSGKGRGAAKVTVRGIRVMPTAPGWQAAKTDTYRKQYQWRKFLDLGQYYRGKYDALVEWDAVAGNPQLVRVPLDGDWQKQTSGNRTWDYKFLKDLSPAQPGAVWDKAETVRVPEPAKPDQPGGHYWYRRTFTLKAPLPGAAYLRFDDLADVAEVYVNGQWIGTQSQTRKRHDWIVENGNRYTNLWNKPPKEIASWQHFERCGIPSPFAPKDLPDGDQMLLPVYTGDYPWPYAFDVSGALKPGENTVAVRLYGSPVKGWWIYRHDETRAYRNVQGLLGPVRLLVDAAPATIERFTQEAVGAVDPADGMVERAFRVVVRGTLPAGAAVRVAGEERELALAPGGEDNGMAVFAGKLRLPTGFGVAAYQADLLDAEGRAVAQRELVFHHTVVAVADSGLTVNGDPFQVRGVNADMGIEWENDRTHTRREWLRNVRRYQQMGFNCLRLEAATPEQLADLLDAGMMTVPLYATASCNNSITALGNLENPDHEFNTDGHKEMALLLQRAPNILLWNSGNENHPTGGYNDKQKMDEFLAVAQRNLKRYDPYRRPVTYANLDSFHTGWFFTAGQDVLGYNTYLENDVFAEQVRQIHRDTGLPILYTEWGFSSSEDRATKERLDNPDAWEKKATEKFRLMRETPGNVGGFLYAYHGEFKDARGRLFMQSLMSGAAVRREGDAIVFENVDACPFRNLNLRLVTGDDVPAAEHVAMLAPGKVLRMAWPKGLAPDAAVTVEADYETHRGLRQTLSRTVK